ncbi:MAG: hypothetical protein GC150_15380 [Rhizobiales bacterium]|nr:hypothetical protein [Hyphomicrobiales bacterium]
MADKTPVLAVPTAGLDGAALREAAAGSYQQLMRLIEEQLRAAAKTAGMADWPYVVALFPEAVVVQLANKLLRYPYTHDGSTVTLGAPTEVVETYKPVAELREAVSASLIEAAKDDTGAPPSKWRIRVIQAGLSANGNLYPDRVLREAVKKFAGARVFAKSDADHLKGAGKDARALLGKLTDPAFIETNAVTGAPAEIQATLALIDPNDAVSSKLREAHARGLSDLFGFSVDMVGRAKAATVSGRTVRVCEAVSRVNSVDLIVEPGAGGQLLTFVEAAQTEDTMLRTQLIDTIKTVRPALLAGKDPATLNDADLTALFTEALKPVATTNATGVTSAELTEVVRMIEARSNARVAIDASRLPDAAKEKLRKQFAALDSFTEADVDQAIKEEREYVGQFRESGRVTGLGDFTRASQGESRAEKIAAMLDAFFDPQHKDHRHARSFKECYIEITGDRKVTGQIVEFDEARFNEAIGSSTFGSVLGNSIHRRLLADYRIEGIYDVWRRVAGTPVPIADFRMNDRTRIGGYGDLPDVDENHPYLELTSPTDEMSQYKVKKKGGLETITLEAIKNDDVSAIQRVPIKMSRAAKRTLSKFVLDFIRTNPTIYDSVALFHASHANLGSTALSAASIAAGRLAMKSQTEPGSGDKLGTPARILMVPDALEETAADIFRRSTNHDKTFVQSLVLDILPIWYWTDVTDWALAADPMDLPGMEIGFLDGEEDPAILIQDAPNQGSVFSHDAITYKIRHVYGGNITDYRAYYKAVVAG